MLLPVEGRKERGTHVYVYMHTHTHTHTHIKRAESAFANIKHFYKDTQ